MFRDFYKMADELRELVSKLPKRKVIWKILTYNNEEYYYITSTYSDASGGTDEVLT